MFCNRFNRVSSLIYYLPRRYQHKKDHWSMVSKKIRSTDRALTHFDDFYGSVFGDKWHSIRHALLKNHKYVAVVNNYSDIEQTETFLERLGAHNIKRLYEVQKKFDGNSINLSEVTSDHSNSNMMQDSYVKKFAEQANRSEIEDIYKGGGGNIVLPETLDTGGAIIGKTDHIKVDADSNKSVENPSLTASLLEAEMDEGRLIPPQFGMSSSSLWTFLPATRIKGCSDWIPESQHYKYYSSANDFPVVVEDDNEIVFPEHLRVYSFEKENFSTFPEAKRGSTGVLNYYLMDGASILPVLALGIKPGDRVLDLCASPGGKSLVALQTLLCNVLAVNDVSDSRINRIYNVLREFLYDFDTDKKWRERILISKVDARDYKDQLGFDKVLVDVPCTTDRHTLKKEDNNIFNHSRVKERLKIPELQSALLSNALSLCRVGGSVVYSTCTLSPVQNDGVVHMALKNAWETFGVRTIIKLSTKSLKPMRVIFNTGRDRTAPRYGHLVVPCSGLNFGPSYFAKFIRTQ